MQLYNNNKKLKIKEKRLDGGSLGFITLSNGSWITHPVSCALCFRTKLDYAFHA